MRRPHPLAGPASQAGFALVEAVVAVGLLGVLGTAILAAAATGVKSVAALESRLVAESLARRQLEEIKAAPFAAGGYVGLPSLPEGFALILVVEAVPGAEPNLQRIEVAVSREGTTQAAIIGFKLNR